MSLLSIEKILSMDYRCTTDEAIRFARLVEAAVLEAQKQEPVGYFSKEDRDHYEPIWEEVTGPEFGIPLYAAPVVQPDIDVLAEYTGQDGKREWKDVGAWLRPGDVIAVLAAAEGKSNA